MEYPEPIPSLLHKSARDFLENLGEKDPYQIIALASQLAGLCLLRSTGIELSRLEAGKVILGAVPDRMYREIQNFIFDWCQTQGFAPQQISGGDLPGERLDYLPEISCLEVNLLKVCRSRGIADEYAPYVAVLAALQTVACGVTEGLFPPGVGLGLYVYHIISGSKTIPHAPEGGKHL